MLTRKPSEYIIGDILRATEGNLAPVSCLEISTTSCPKIDSCPMALFWNNLHNAVIDYIDSITLADIIEKAKMSKRPSVTAIRANKSAGLKTAFSFI